MNLEVHIVTTEPGQVAHIEVPEGTDEHDMPAVMQRLQGWLMGHKEPNLPVIVVRQLREAAAGSYPVEVHAPFGKPLDDDAVPRLRAGKWPVDLKDEPSHRVARCTYRGRGDKLLPFEHAFVMFLRGQGQEPTGQVRHVFHVIGNAEGEWVVDVEVELPAAE